MAPYTGPGWVRGDDYLTVDVWTPWADSNEAPVMVYVHGGGFLGGSSQALLYHGESFARDGVVFISLNYRLGAAGFMDVPGRPDNRGMLDVVAALQWVRANAARFGGDSDNVTLCGQSAGAILVGALLAAPDANHLFRRAIIQSGTGAGAFSPEQASIVASEVADLLKIDLTGEDLAAVSDDALVDAVSWLGVVSHDVVDVLGHMSRLAADAPCDQRRLVA